MKKYFLVFQQSFSLFTTYRLEIFFQIIQNFIPSAIMIAALSFSVPTSTIQVINLIPYYVLISLIYPLIRSGIDEEMDNLTNSGQINTFLLKPFSLFKWLYSKSLSEKMLILLTLSPVLLLVLVISNFTFFKLLFLSISLFIAFTLSFTLSYFIGLFCFWIEDFWAVHNVKHVTIQLLGGIVLPYSFFPDDIASILRFTPFPYIVSWPVKIIQNQINYVDVFTSITWIMILFFLVRILQYKAIQKYSFTAL